MPSCPRPPHRVGTFQRYGSSTIVLSAPSTSRSSNSYLQCDAQSACMSSGVIGRHPKGGRNRQSPRLLSLNDADRNADRRRRGGARCRRLRRRRARARHRPGRRDGPRAHARVDGRRSASPHARRGAHLVLEPEPQGALAQGRHLRRPAVGARRVLRLRHGHLAVRGRAGGPRRVPHGRAHLLLSRVWERGSARQVVSGPTRDEFVALAREYTVVPVWREVLADLETPVSAFAKLVGDREGFLLESVEHGGHWGRFSFIGRDPALTLVARGQRVEISGGATTPFLPRDQGILAALEALLAWYRAPTLPDLPPL